MVYIMIPIQGNIKHLFIQNTKIPYNLSTIYILYGKLSIYNFGNSTLSAPCILDDPNDKYLLDPVQNGYFSWISLTWPSYCHSNRGSC